MQIMNQQSELEAEWLFHKQGAYGSSQHQAIEVRYRDTPPESDPSKTSSGRTRDDHGALNPEKSIWPQRRLMEFGTPRVFP
jgi:hypothetical protein